MQEIFVAPFLLGLSIGIYCFAYCAPFIAPFMVSQARERKENFLVISKFISGRFLGYMVFGAIFGYLGEKIQDSTVNLILIIALMLLSCLLILHGLGLMKSKRFSFCRRFKKYNPKLPVLMGFLMGVNICPPFLMSLTYVFSLHSVLKGMIYFLMFFIGTTLYFLPVAFLGYLNKIKEFQWVGRVSALVVGSFFLVYGVYHISRGFLIFHSF